MTAATQHYGTAAKERKESSLLLAFQRLVMPAAKQARPKADDTLREFTFTFDTIALCAKLVRVDGAVNKEEFLAFRDLFPMQDSESDKIRKLFIMACEDSEDYLDHAKRIARLYKPGSPVIQQLMDRLFAVANADQSINKVELVFLARIAKAMGVTRTEFQKLKRRHLTSAKTCPYQLLGVSPKMPSSDLKLHYRRLMQNYHPDRMAQRAASVELTELAHRKVAVWNEAYDRILRARGLK